MLLSAACSGGDIAVGNFGGGTYDGWSAEGDAFGVAPIPGGDFGLPGEFVASTQGKSEGARGTLTSEVFTIEREYINFLLGGTAGQNVYAELIVGGRSVYRTSPYRGMQGLNWVSWDVGSLAGSEARVVFTDNGGGRRPTSIMAGRVEMSKRKKSAYVEEYDMALTLDKRYVIIPVQDSAPDSRVSVAVGGETVLSMDVRVARDAVDYYVPVDLGMYKGERADIKFGNVWEDSKGITGITQSDEFVFAYDEPYRYDYHFTPYRGWTNDPNGMVYHDGEYHLFYQHNPYGSTWGNMHWGHAVSRDLHTWEHLPDALAPDELGSIFSGSAVIDKENTAGVGKDALIAIYTSAGRIQTQSIAYSLDNGRTFTKYADNPVLVDSTIRDFRDPKVMWHAQSRKWVMTLATSQTVTFYGSKDLKEWDKLSSFGDGIGAHGGVWECPDLFPVDYRGRTKWVLLVSINPGGPNGGSATQYFIGDFDGKTFRPDALPYPLWLDYGRDNYAGITWSNAPAGRHIFIGWMSNWAYANDVPTVNFRAGMTVPRELSIDHNGKHAVLANYPVGELEALRAVVTGSDDFSVADGAPHTQAIAPGNGVFEIEMTVSPGAASAFGFALKNARGEQLSYRFDIAAGTLSADRAAAGDKDFSANFAPAVITAPLEKCDTYAIRLMMDRASTELFVNGGRTVMTNLVFPSEPYDSVELTAEGGAARVAGMKIYELK